MATNSSRDDANSSASVEDGPGAIFDLQRRLAFMDLNSDDSQRVRRLLPLFQESREEFVEAFYRHLFSFEETAKFLQQPELVARLKEAQCQHFETMLGASWDQEYLDRRLRIGDRHAEVGIEPQWFLGAYYQYVQFSIRYFSKLATTLTPQDATEHLLSLLKVVLFDIGVSLDAYFMHATKNMQSALDMLWRANAELRQFAQLTSHDLKTPLATVANLCDEAIDEFGHEMPKEACELIEKARQRTFRMSNMINELLAISTATNVTELSSLIPVEQAVDEAFERVRPVADRKHCEFVVTRPLPSVWGNLVRLREAIYNVVSNCVKYMDKPHGDIRLEARLDPPWCTLVIMDNGPGIPAEELSRIFAPFRRVGTQKEQPGSGLGLYFTKNLVEQMGGQVWAEAELGRGSRFFIRLRTQAP
jgi:signal transduction histidine kinase